MHAADCRPASADFSQTEALADHLHRETACSRDAAFLYRLGRLLNLAQRYPEAADRLESALLHNPADQAILVEYAVALAGSGDPVAAQHLLVQAREHPAADETTRHQVDALLNRAAWLAHMPKGSLSVSLGYDDNLLGAPGQSSIDLTLPYGNLTLELARDQQPRPGSFARTDLRLDGTLPVDGQELRYGFFGTIRQTPGNPADRTHWGGLLEKSNTPLFGAYAQIAYQQLKLNGIQVFRQAHGGLGFGSATALWGAECRQRGGIELQRRDYPATAKLNGDYSGLYLQINCYQPAVHASLRLGNDRPRDDTRPGTDQHQVALRIARQFEVFGAGLLAEAEWTWQRDTTGYSPLLENNRRRLLQRNSVHLEYRWKTSHWQPFVGFEWLDQRANLPLFALRNRILTLGISTSW